MAENDHARLNRFVSELLKIYRTCPAFYDQDSVGEGLQWINADDGYRSIYSFVRHGKDLKDNVLVVINFTPVDRSDYRVGLPCGAKLKLILDSSDPRFAAEGVETESDKKKIYHTEKSECDNQPYSIAYPLPAYGVAFFEYKKEDIEPEIEDIKEEKEDTASETKKRTTRLM